MTFSEVTSIALAEMREELEKTSMPTWLSHSRRHLEYWGPERLLTTVTRLEVQVWINARHKAGLKVSTIGHERCFLSRLWRVLEDRGLDAGLQCPLLRLRMPKKLADKRKITLEVVEALQTYLDSEDWDLVEFTLLTFLRRLEVFRIQASHILTSKDAKGNTIYRVNIITSKTGKARIVPLSSRAVAIILRRIALAKSRGSIYLFGGQSENRFSVACSWAKAVWRPAILTIGKGGHFHGLRHLGAHKAWKNGAPIEAISKMLGHSTIAQTEHYIGVSEDSMWAAANAAAKSSLIDPPPVPRPDLVDPITVQPVEPMKPIPEPCRKPMRATQLTLY